MTLPTQLNLHILPCVQGERGMQKKTQKLLIASADNYVIGSQQKLRQSLKTYDFPGKSQCFEVEKMEYFVEPQGSQELYHCRKKHGKYEIVVALLQPNIVSTTVPSPISCNIIACSRVMCPCAEGK